METDPARIPVYIAASTLVLTLVIVLAGRPGGGRTPSWLGAFGVAFAISAIGIGFAKFGAYFGLPWWLYYTLPALATVSLPPLAFRFALWRTGLYLVLASVTAPAIHAAFFYALDWGDYMPFLRLPSL